MSTTPQRGPGMLTPALYPIPYATATGGQINGAAGPLTLAAGQTQVIPAGQFMIQPGSYTFLQAKDPITGLWRMASANPGVARFVDSDGQNYRLANLTGCPVGALMTNVGSGYTSAPTVAASAGSSAWTAVVGGAINSTVTVTTAGAGYVHPPTLVFSAPPAGGIQASGIAVVSGGAISSVTVTNQGGGYTVAPTITVVPSPLDTITTTAVLTVNATLAGSGTVVGVLCTDPGVPQTSVVTLSFTGGGGASAAATVVGCYACTGFTKAVDGAGYGNAQPMLLVTGGGVTAGTPGSVVNPQLGAGIFQPRQANISLTSTAGGIIQTSGAVINDAGLFQAVPLGFVIAGGTGLATTTAGATMTIGGITDTSLIFPV